MVEEEGLMVVRSPLSWSTPPLRSLQRNAVAPQRPRHLISFPASHFSGTPPVSDGLAGENDRDDDDSLP